MDIQLGVEAGALHKLPGDGNGVLVEALNDVATRIGQGKGNLCHGDLVHRATVVPSAAEPRTAAGVAQRDLPGGVRQGAARQDQRGASEAGTEEESPSHGGGLARPAGTINSAPGVLDPYAPL